MPHYSDYWTEFNNVTYHRRKLVWKHGYFHMQLSNNADAERDAELFHSLYSSCTFTPGVG
jgi:hypothetical protein